MIPHDRGQIKGAVGTAGIVLESHGMEHVACALCGVDDTTPYKQENGFQALQCRRCGLVYVNPRPTIEQMKHLYDGQETHVQVGTHIRAMDKKRIDARYALWFLRRHMSSGRILEIGSGAGYFLEQAKQAGYTVQGLDIMRDFVAYSSQVLGVPTVEGTLQTAPFADGSFDVIYFRDVLSHLAAPREELGRMYRLLAPGGILFFETGNVAELAAEQAGLLDLPDHLYHWSEATIRTLLQHTGFEHVETRRYTLVLQLPSVRWVRRLRAKRSTASAAPRSSTDEVPETVPRSSLGKRLDAHVGNLLRYGLGSVVPGRSRRCTLVVVARRP
ncbi:MAG TPA: class I SAM-dependent methyltransferase [Haliangium sp.]|nr:class I SAM-dependent methyltransferase [Haliangium sp.]